MANWYKENVASDWMDCRGRIMHLLQEEAELEEIVKLVGMDALSAPDRLKLEAARSIREDFLHQNAFHETDTYTSLDKQYKMMHLVLAYFDLSTMALKNGADIEKLVSLPERERVGRFKYVQNENTEKEYEDIMLNLEKSINNLTTKGDNEDA